MAVLPTNYTDAVTPTGVTSELPATTVRGINAINTEINSKIAGAGAGNTAAQAAASVPTAATGLYVTGSALAVPTDVAVGTRFRWTIAVAKTATGTGAFNVIIFRGTNGTNADTADVAQSIGTQTAVVDNMVLDIEVVITATGATGSYYWTIVAQNKAVTATGFGIATGAGQFSGSAASKALNTANLKLGIGLQSVTTAATATIPLVRANVFR
jgi:hypothetical protein